MYKCHFLKREFATLRPYAARSDQTNHPRARDVQKALCVGYLLLLSSAPTRDWDCPKICKEESSRCKSSSSGLSLLSAPYLALIPCMIIWGKTLQDQNMQLIFELVNPCIGMAWDQFQQISLIQVHSIQRRQLVSRQLVCVLSVSLTVGWPFRAHVHRCNACGPWLLLSERLARITAPHCCNQTVPQWRNHAALAWIRRETLYCLFIKDAYIFSRIEKKNYQKPFVINISHPTLKLNSAFKKTNVSLPNKLRSLCVELTESIDSECTWMHAVLESILEL